MAAESKVNCKLQSVKELHKAKGLGCSPEEESARVLGGCSETSASVAVGQTTRYSCWTWGSLSHLGLGMWRSWRGGFRIVGGSSEKELRQELGFSQEHSRKEKILARGFEEFWGQLGVVGGCRLRKVGVLI